LSAFFISVLFLFIVFIVSAAFFLSEKSHPFLYHASAWVFHTARIDVPKKLRKNPFFRCKSRDFNPKRIPFRSFFSAGIPKQKRFAAKNTNRHSLFVQYEFYYITITNRSQEKKKIYTFFCPFGVYMEFTL